MARPAPPPPIPKPEVAANGAMDSTLARIPSVHTRCIIKFKGFLVELIENKRS